MSENSRFPDIRETVERTDAIMQSANLPRGDRARVAYAYLHLAIPALLRMDPGEFEGLRRTMYRLYNVYFKIGHRFPTEKERWARGSRQA